MTYVWSVRAVDEEGNPLGDTQDGWAEPHSVTIGDVDATLAGGGDSSGQELRPHSRFWSRLGIGHHYYLLSYDVRIAPAPEDTTDSGSRRDVTVETEGEPPVVAHEMTRSEAKWPPNHTTDMSKTSKPVVHTERISAAGDEGGDPQTLDRRTREILLKALAASRFEVSSGRLALELGADSRLAGRSLTIAEDIILDDEESAKLGVEFLAIRKGTYVIDRTSSANGTVVLTATTSFTEVTLDGEEFEIIDSSDPSLVGLRREHQVGVSDCTHSRSLSKARAVKGDPDSSITGPDSTLTDTTLTDSTYALRFVTGDTANRSAIHKRKKSSRHIVDCPHW
jgi:hypothetical protein